MMPFVPHCGVCGSPMPACMCHAQVAPTMPAPAPKTTIARFRKFGYFTYCDICQLEMSFCKGHALPEFGAEPTSDLEKRVREAQKR